MILIVLALPIIAVRFQSSKEHVTEVVMIVLEKRHYKKLRALFQKNKQNTLLVKKNNVPKAGVMITDINMTKIIRFSMSKGDPILLPLEKAEKVIDIDMQSVKIMNDDGTWSGKLLNKAFLVSTDVDVPATNAENIKSGREHKYLPSQNERGTKTMKEVLEKNRPQFLLGEES